VRCAVGIQAAAASRKSDPSTKQRIVLRIGIRIGDVVGEADDILGDAVNVASRIEPLAEPGGICLSRTVYEQVRNKLPYGIEKMGARELKNVEVPVELYRVVVTAESTLPYPSDEDSAILRLAVLPFASMSPEASDAYFADGLTDELITQASRNPSLRVVSRTSVLRYKAAPKPLREVAQELGGPARPRGQRPYGGHQVRITVKLVDTGSEESLWSSRYDRPFDDIFAIQDDIAGKVAAAISDHLLQRRSGGTIALPPTPPDTQERGRTPVSCMAGN
jgi:adenylate cyclase